MAGKRFFASSMTRHSALLRLSDQLFVFYTRRRDAPERVLLSTIDLSDDWRSWTETPSFEVLRPERSWEGADLPVEPTYPNLQPIAKHPYHLKAEDLTPPDAVLA